MRRSLTYKLILAFLLVSITGAALTSVFARIIAVRDFQKLVLEQSQEQFLEEITAYYLEHGSWQDIALAYQREGPTPGDAPSSRVEPAGQPNVPPPALVFALATSDGYVVLPARPFEMGTIVPADVLESGIEVIVNGQTVGIAIATGREPELAVREQEYLQDTIQASLYAALAATLAALVLGVVLSRSMTTPLRRLTKAARALATGQLDQRVTVTSKDELGELATAFNQMSSDLQRADEQRRQMTADVAHDLRTPLTVIAGYLEALRDGVLQPTEARFETMYQEAQHLMRLVDDLRTLSLADAGSLPLSWQKISPGSLLDQVATIYSHQAAQHQVQLKVQNELQLPDIYADTDRLLQVVGNLVNNALRYTPPKGQITLKALRTPEQVVISISDTGSGIPPEALPHVFDRFYRVDSSREASGEQSGLGLAIAKSLIELQGGTITVTSQLGQGTTFAISLPNAGPQQTAHAS